MFNERICAEVLDRMKVVIDEGYRDLAGYATLSDEDRKDYNILYASLEKSVDEMFVSMGKRKYDPFSVDEFTRDLIIESLTHSIQVRFRALKHPGPEAGESNPDGH